MEYRTLGGSGLKVPGLTLGTGTFGGGERVLRGLRRDRRSAAPSSTRRHLSRGGGDDVRHRRRLFGRPRRKQIWPGDGRASAAHVIISTKGALRTGSGPNEVGSVAAPPRRRGRGEPAPARHRLHRSVPAARVSTRPRRSTRRWARSTISSRAGKVRYIGCSNFSGWHLMKSLRTSDCHGLARTSRIRRIPRVGREYEWELVPSGLDQQVGRSCGARSAGGG